MHQASIDMNCSIVKDGVIMVFLFIAEVHYALECNRKSEQL